MTMMMMMMMMRRFARRGARVVYNDFIRRSQPLHSPLASAPLACTPRASVPLARAPLGPFHFHSAPFATAPLAPFHGGTDVVFNVHPTPKLSDAASLSLEERYAKCISDIRDRLGGPTKYYGIPALHNSHLSPYLDVILESEKARTPIALTIRIRKRDGYLVAYRSGDNDRWDIVDAEEMKNVPGRLVSFPEKYDPAKYKKATVLGPETLLAAVNHLAMGDDSSNNQNHFMMIAIHTIEAARNKDLEQHIRSLMQQRVYGAFTCRQKHFIHQWGNLSDAVRSVCISQ